MQQGEGTVEDEGEAGEAEGFVRGAQCEERKEKGRIETC
jgi:hypothetical protein